MAGQSVGMGFLACSLGWRWPGSVLTWEWVPWELSLAWEGEAGAGAGRARMTPGAQSLTL